MPTGAVIFAVSVSIGDYKTFFVHIPSKNKTSPDDTARGGFIVTNF
jgi:hypothetical protein